LIQFDVEYESEVRRTATKYDVQVVPFTEREREHIVLDAIRERFVGPIVLLDAIRQKLSGTDVVFASPVESSEKVSLEEYSEFLRSPDTIKLAEVLREHGSQK